MNSESTIRLEDGVQVRGEKFGLLFYDYRGPKLYFVPSRDLIEEDFFNGKMTIDDLIETVCQKDVKWPRLWVQNQIRRVLEMLHGKGLICEQSIC